MSQPNLLTLQEWWNPDASYDTKDGAITLWRGPGEQPTAEDLQTAWDAYTEMLSARKVWPTVADFWAEFMPEEKAAIITSEITGIKVLYAELTMWRGEVWSDDPAGGGRVMQGLDALVSVKILTTDRHAEILAKS